MTPSWFVKPLKWETLDVTDSTMELDALKFKTLVNTATGLAIHGRELHFRTRAAFPLRDDHKPMLKLHSVWVSGESTTQVSKEAVMVRAVLDTYLFTANNHSDRRLLVEMLLELRCRIQAKLV
ncbi:hypothetical protein WICPIJ_001153 [Wickerhamomyces pijperi]|uniref:Uncharacterized protein n=1 Tax=Wickerhamomyces pijperi TaxID=599730 RepID=A0A9P8TR05_WICPI|nr:hypothetical protein WICPIJ_001153 [Wickerhamomyces pijperi]